MNQLSRKYSIASTLKNTKLSKIKGISYKISKKVFRTSDRESFSINTILSPYLEGVFNMNQNLRHIIKTSRGCPFHCDYCIYSIRIFNRLRFFPMKHVKKEIDCIITRHNI